jgi:hypothetical protein
MLPTIKLAAAAAADTTAAAHQLGKAAAAEAVIQLLQSHQLLTQQVRAPETV